MSGQGGLSEQTTAYARRGDPETSVLAAKSVRATRLEKTVLAALRRRPQGATSFELAEDLQMSLVTISPRLRPLANKGLVMDSGRRKAGASGRQQTVWVVVQKPDQLDLWRAHGSQQNSDSASHA